jgi:hypothetical protein
MGENHLTNGILWFVTALLLSSMSSFLGRLDLLGSATNLAQGFLDGLSVVACGAPIALLVRSRQRA